MTHGAVLRSRVRNNLPLCPGPSTILEPPDCPGATMRRRARGTRGPECHGAAVSLAGRGPTGRRRRTHLVNCQRIWKNSRVRPPRTNDTALKLNKIPGPSGRGSLGQRTSWSSVECKY